MWSNDDHSSLIRAVEHQVLKLFPVTSTNNNHDFTGNLLDIADDWSEIAEILNRSGESNVTNINTIKFIHCGGLCKPF